MEKAAQINSTASSKFKKMKTIITLFLTFSFLQIAFAQGTYTDEQRQKDKAKLDSICKKSPNSCIYYNEIIGVNSIFKNHAPRRIVRNSKICFNKKFEYTVTGNGKTTFGCYYINTRDGYVAQFLNEGNESCRGMEKPEPGFNMMITSKVGESFIFRIDNRGVKTFMAQMPIEGVPYGGSTNFVVKYPGALSSPYRELFTNEKLPTLPYIIEGISDSSSKYLFGPYLAERIPLKDYIGAYGTGYYADGIASTFICLGIENPESFVKIIKITDVNECFDGSEFKDEVTRNTYLNDQFLKEKDENLRNKESGMNTTDCDAKPNLIKFKREVVKKEINYNKYLQDGGNPQSTAGLKLGAMAQDVVDQVIIHRYETQIKICEQKYTIQLSSQQSNAAQIKEKALKKIECYSLAVNQLNELENTLNEINQRNRNDDAKSLMEKNKAYLDKMKDINLDCNTNKWGNTKVSPLDNGSKILRDQLMEKIKRKK